MPYQITGRLHVTAVLKPEFMGSGLEEYILASNIKRMMYARCLCRQEEDQLILTQGFALPAEKKKPTPLWPYTLVGMEEVFAELWLNDVDFCWEMHQQRELCLRTWCATTKIVYDKERRALTIKSFRGNTSSEEWISFFTDVLIKVDQVIQTVKRITALESTLDESCKTSSFESAKMMLLQQIMLPLRLYSL